MIDNYVTIGDLTQLETINDSCKLLIDDTSNGDTKSASVNVLKSYLIEDLTPSINTETMTWHIGGVDTEMSAVAGVQIWKQNNNYALNDFVCHNDEIFRCTISPQTDISIFNPIEWTSVSSKTIYANDEDINNLITSLWGVTNE